VDVAGALPIISRGSLVRRMRRKLSFPLFPTALAIVAFIAAIAALFVPTAVSLVLVGIAIALVAFGVFTLARQL
jgi:uncharacterized membrane protein YdbT with pleckstrin-like domain